MCVSSLSLVFFVANVHILVAISTRSSVSSATCVELMWVDIFRILIIVPKFTVYFAVA